MKSTKEILYFENLDGLRFLAAFSVLVFHSFGRLKQFNSFQESVICRVLSFLAEKGDHGVSFFFVLSGFLITYLTLKEIDKNKSFNAINFFLRRAFRIWPVYFIVVFYGLYISPLLFHHLFFGKKLMYFSFLANFDMIRHFPGTVYFQNFFMNVLWSVSIEEQYYFCWATLMFFLQLKRVFHFVCFFIAVILVSSLYRILYPNEVYHTLFVISDLGVGGLLAICVFNYQGIVKSLRTISKPIIIIIYILGFIILFYENIFQIEIFYFKRLMLTFFWAFIIFEQSFMENSFYKMSKSKILSKLGKITYGVYMYHSIMIIVIQAFWIKYSWPSDDEVVFYLQLTLITITTILVSSLSYNFIEFPLLKIKDRFK